MITTSLLYDVAVWPDGSVDCREDHNIDQWSDVLQHDVMEFPAGTDFETVVQYMQALEINPHDYLSNFEHLLDIQNQG